MTMSISVIAQSAEELEVLFQDSKEWDSNGLCKFWVEVHFDEMEILVKIYDRNREKEILDKIENSGIPVTHVESSYVGNLGFIYLHVDRSKRMTNILKDI